ncbi:MAG: phosphate-starvation-inducible PsiE family protein [Deltaproteobacteria bacterium]|nr:phosphate-starvation-inducible PsiE family protein [Deltaproteobacteria bacterium]
MEPETGHEDYLPQRRHVLKFLNRVLDFVDEVILVLAAIGIMAVAGLLMFEAASDFIFYTQHSISHIISDLLFVLIIMELFRQVMRQLNRHTFSLNPFIYIGVIASIRGLLLTQMKLGLGESEWKSGVIQLSIHAGIVFVLVISLFFYSKCKFKED